MRRWTLVACLLLACLAGGCAERLGTPYRVTITLEAEVLGERRSVAQVFEFQHFQCRQSFCAPNEVSGDALGFDMGERGLLVAPIDGKLSWLLFMVLDARQQNRRVPRDVHPSTAEDLRLLDTARGDYDFDPSFVFQEWLHFLDRLDPASGRHITLSDNNREPMRGKIRLISATIAKTRQAVTRGLAAKLPWLAARGDKLIEVKDAEGLLYGFGQAHFTAPQFVAHRD